jgi:hypothetical protein
MPPSTELEVRRLRAEIQAHCCDPATPEREEKLSGLAQQLRAAIKRHLQMSKIALRTKLSVIDPRKHDAA